MMRLSDLFREARMKKMEKFFFYKLFSVGSRTTGQNAKTMKYSKKFERDYEFYLNNKKSFSFSGVHVSVDSDPETGLAPKKP